MSVVHNEQEPKSALCKKLNQICYHVVRESDAMGESLVGHIASTENQADLAMKLLQGGTKCSQLVDKLL